LDGVFEEEKNKNVVAKIDPKDDFSNTNLFWIWYEKIQNHIDALD
jgi:hypothetical protein